MAVTPPTGSQDESDKQSSGGWVEALRTISGLLAVLLGLASLTLIALFGMGFVKTDNPSVVSIAAASFGVAAHLDPKQASDAIDQYQRLRGESDSTG